MRADAQRNVAAVVDAAKQVFLSTGVDAPAKEITDRAGVGVGTLYRHFPKRSDLIIAVMQHEIDECVAAAPELAATTTPWDAVVRWIDRFTAFVVTKHGFAAALHSGDPAYDGLAQRLFDQVLSAFAGLLDTAVRDGVVRADVPARDVLLGISLLCQAESREGADFPRRMAAVLADGLRPQSA